MSEINIHKNVGERTRMTTTSDRDSEFSHGKGVVNDSEAT